MALAMARESRMPSNDHGAQPGIVYCSAEAHMSIGKAVALLGILTGDLFGLASGLSGLPFRPKLFDSLQPFFQLLLVCRLAIVLMAGVAAGWSLTALGVRITTAPRS